MALEKGQPNTPCQGNPSLLLSLIWVLTLTACGRFKRCVFPFVFQSRKEGSPSIYFFTLCWYILFSESVLYGCFGSNILYFMAYWIAPDQLFWSFSCSRMRNGCWGDVAPVHASVLHSCDLLLFPTIEWIPSHKRTTAELNAVTKQISCLLQNNQVNLYNCNSWFQTVYKVLLATFAISETFIFTRFIHYQKGKCGEDKSI